MKKFMTCLVAASLMGVASTAIADHHKTEETRAYVTPMASFTIPDDELGLGSDAQLGGQLSIGKNFGDYFAMELYAFRYDDVGLRGPGGANADISGFGLSALFFPARDILPVYALVGAGIGQMDFDGTNTQADDENTQFYDLGIGYMVPLNDYGVKLRAEYRYRGTNVDLPGGTGEVSSNIISVGIQVPLGAPAQPPEPEPEPAPAPVVPTDSDGDGVIDRIDQCPGTLRGVEVDATGCPIEEEPTVILRGVTFEFDSAKLTAQAERRLNEVIEALKANRDITFSIAGHTDSIGSKSYNQALSERRAQSVKEYLVEHGISPSRITRVVGYGEARPVATNETEAGRAQNRRVELHVTSR